MVKNILISFILKQLHKNDYLNEYFQFNKNYDNLLSLENKFIKTESEKHIQIKIPKNNNATIKNDYVELLAHLIDLTPKYFDLTYSEKKERFLSLLSENPITVINFDLFIPSILLNCIILILIFLKMIMKKKNLKFGMEKKQKFLILFIQN